MKTPKCVVFGLVGLLSLSLSACAGDSEDPQAGGVSNTELSRIAANDDTQTEDGQDEDAPIEFKLAFNQTEDHPQYLAAVALGEGLSLATDGRYTVTAFANEELGDQGAVLHGVSDDTAEMMLISGPVLENLNPDFVVYNLPYMFESYEAQTAHFDDERVNADLFNSLAEEHNLTVLGAVHGGIRSLYTVANPIRTPEDLDGLKIRVQQSAAQVKMIEMLGGIASPMGQGEVYSAFQTGVLDGAQNNETVYDALEHDEFAKYYSYTRHLMTPDYLLIRTETLDSMPAADRQALLDLVPQFRQTANGGFSKFAQDSKDAAIERGCKFNDDVDVDAFKKLLKPFVEDQLGDSQVRRSLYAAVQRANAAHPAEPTDATSSTPSPSPADSDADGSTEDQPRESGE